MGSIAVPPRSAHGEEPLVFLCHSSNDKEHVRDLYQRLKSDGIRCWFDEEDLIPGQTWEREINRALRRATYVLVCLSESSITRRGFIQKELKVALDIADEIPEGEIYLIPVRLERCEIPDRLRRLQWVDLFTDAGYGQLVRAFGAAVGGHASSRYAAITGSIYISYRYGDAGSVAILVIEKLRTYLTYSRVFSNRKLWNPWSTGQATSVKELDRIDVLIVLIGSRWLSFDWNDEPEGPLASRNDSTVRREIEFALTERKVIVPLLVDGASMPTADDLPEALKPLAGYQPFNISVATIDGDADRLLRGIGRLLADVNQ